MPESNRITIKNIARQRFSVLREGEPVGTATLYDNPLHARHSYLRLALSEYDGTVAAELFDLLAKAAGKPLQAMLPSDDTELAAFLTAGGFILKRRCFETEAGREDLLPEALALPLPAISVCRTGETEYRECCMLLYDYYRAAHEAVSPLTADYRSFCEKLPETALFCAADGRIVHAAFIEANELAYIASAEPLNVRPFACAAAEYLFREHRRIFFECDDCDAAAMALRSLFRHDEESFDTYVR
ncbi:MAG: hypothetical protein IK064_07135 [Clostridia bacterium]|nr:hypothetical protein [Clostridia bacterium]